MNVSISSNDSNFEQLSYESTWRNTTEMTLTNIMNPEVLRFAVNNDDEIGGFVATIQLQCDDGHSATIITDDGNTHFDAMYTENGEHETSEMNEFIRFSNGSRSGIVNESTVQCMDPNAYWMWNGNHSDHIVFALDLFANDSSRDTVEPTNSPHPMPTTNPSQSPIHPQFQVALSYEGTCALIFPNVTCWGSRCLYPHCLCPSDFSQILK